MKKIISLTVNGDTYEVAVSPWETLLDILRDDLGLMGTKRGCGIGTCGVCTVVIDGKAVLSCLTLAIECEGRAIETIEGIGKEGELHPVQRSFIENGAIQCGYCTPGIIMTAKALLDEIPHPSDDEIREALAGTFCRCTGHVKILEAVRKAAEMEGEEESHAPER